MPPSRHLDQVLLAEQNDIRRIDASRVHSHERKYARRSPRDHPRRINCSTIQKNISPKKHLGQVLLVKQNEVPKIEATVFTTREAEWSHSPNEGSARSANCARRSHTQSETKYVAPPVDHVLQATSHGETATIGPTKAPGHPPSYR